MRPADFTANSPGHFVSSLNGTLAFVPAPLPPAIDMNIVGLSLGDAMQAIGELRGACRRLRNPYILIGPLQRQEALTSSAMEGTFTSADELILAEHGIERPGDDSTREVRNYIRALNRGIDMLQTLPLSHRVLKEAHTHLLAGLSSNRGAQKRPGEYKADQNWIGGRTIEVARYVPPPPAETRMCMDALERYINREERIFPSPLMDLALVHYQVEAIHPFADGNGRIGRMLIALMAMENGLLDLPVLYISPAMERHKDEYIDLMFNVSAKAEWHPWLTFFFARVIESCQETIATIDRLISLHETYRKQASEAMRSASAVTLVDKLFEHPAMSINDAANLLGVTYAAARKTIDRLVDINILEEFPAVYPKMFIARGILRAARPEE